MLDCKPLSDLVAISKDAHGWIQFAYSSGSTLHAATITVTEATHPKLPPGNLARALKAVSLVHLDGRLAESAGILRSAVGGQRPNQRDLTADAVVAATACFLADRPGHPVLLLTGDPKDMRLLLQARTDVTVVEV